MIIRRSPRAFIYRPGQPPILVRGGGGSGGGGGGVTDHGALTGLTDDDHSQYALADGTRGNFATVAQGGKADTATQPADLSSAISTHAAASDPHGDRAYAAANFAPLRMTYTAAFNINAGEFVVLVNGTTWAKADASTVGTCAGIIGRAESTVSMGDPLSALVRGIIDLGFLSPVGSGETVFVSTTPGVLQLGPPPAIGRMVGYLQNYGIGYLLYFDGAANVPLLGTGTGMAISAADTRVTAQDITAWEAGVGTSETVVSPAKVAAAIAALGGGSPAGSTNELQRNDGGSFGGATGVTWASNQLLIAAQDAATVPLAVRAAASHTANGFEFQNSAGTPEMLITSQGALRLRTAASGVAGYVTLCASSSNLQIYRQTALQVMMDQGVQVASSLYFGIAPGTPGEGAADARLYRLAPGVFQIRGKTTGGGLNIMEVSVDPADPAEGTFTLWMSDGTASGDDGDIMAKITAGGVTKTATLIDFSAV